MISTRRGLVIIVLAAILCALGCPYISGYYYQRSLEKWTQHLSSETQGSAQLRNYHRGWWNSTADLTINIENNPLVQKLLKSANDHAVKIPDALFQWTIPLSIQNGPFLLITDKQLRSRFQGLRGYATGQLNYPPEMAAILQKYLGQFPYIKMTLLADWMGNITLNIDSNGAHSLNRNLSTRFDWNGFSKSIAMDPSFSHITTQMEVQPIDLVTTEGDFKTGLINLHSQTNRSFYDLNLHDLVLKLAEFSWSPQHKNLVSVNDLQFSVQNTLSGSSMNAIVKGQFASLNIRDKTLGPAHLVLNLRDLDAELLKQLKAMAPLIQSDNTSSQNATSLFAMFPKIVALFSKGGEMNLSTADVKLPNGLVSIQSKISMDVNKSPQTDMNTFSALKTFIQNSHFVLSLSAPEKVWLDFLSVNYDKLQPPSDKPSVSGNTPNKTPNDVSSQAAWVTRLQEWQQQGWLIALNNQYQCTVSYDKGTLEINHHKLPFSLPLS